MTMMVEVLSIGCHWLQEWSMRVFRKLMAASCFLVATMIAGCAAEAAQATTAAPLRLVAQWRMGGEGGWDLLAVYDPAGRVFVNIESEPGQIARIDLDSLTVGATWPLAGCDDPTGLAID